MAEAATPMTRLTVLGKRLRKAAAIECSEESLEATNETSFNRSLDGGASEKHETAKSVQSGKSVGLTAQLKMVENLRELKCIEQHHSEVLSDGVGIHHHQNCSVDAQLTPFKRQRLSPAKSSINEEKIRSSGDSFTSEAEETIELNSSKITSP